MGTEDMDMEEATEMEVAVVGDGVDGVDGGGQDPGSDGPTMPPKLPM